MSDDEGPNGISAPNSEPNSAPQSPPPDEDDEQQENGAGEDEEGEGEEVDENDESDPGEDGAAPGDENGEDGAEVAGGEGADTRGATAQPQRQTTSGASDLQGQASQSAAQPAKEKKARVRKWERKWVRIGHLQLLKWVPLEARDASALERAEKNLLKRQNADNAPVTRSTTAAYHQRVRLERRAATRTVSYRDQEEETGDSRDDDEPAQNKRRRADDD